MGKHSPGAPNRVSREQATSLEEVALVYERFGEAIIDEVADLVPIVKFQLAFFEAAGPSGMAALSRLSALAHERRLLVIFDGKRNDIGSTASAYAQAYLSGVQLGDRHLYPYANDALTVSPYMGPDTVGTFADAARQHGKGLFVLVRTSNPGAGKLQDVTAGSITNAEHVASWVHDFNQRELGSDHLGRYGSIGAVVGATAPQQLVELRKQMPTTWLLIPGYGTQGGTARDIAPAFDQRGLGAIVNNSRGIMFAYQQDRFKTLSWREAIRQATLAMIADLKT